MGLFKKKPDPISERARDLNKQISDLEKEIRKLSSQEKRLPARDASDQEESRAETAPPPPAAAAPIPKPPPGKPAQPEPPKAKPLPSGPKIRSTSIPQGPHVPLKVSEAPSPTLFSSAPAPRSTQDTIFEELGQNPFRSSSSPAKTPDSELGIRQDTLSSNWQRLKNHFRGPATSNPKLVNYLAAGSIQGLRPLRYERRVARNRTIVLVAILLLFLCGVLALLLKS